MTTRFFALRTRIRFVCYASNLLRPYPGEGVAGIFYIDNMANGRKDEAMTEYGPQFRTSSLLSRKERNCGSEQGYHVSRLTVRSRMRCRSFYFRKRYKHEFSRKNQSGRNQGRYTHFRSRQSLLRPPAARLGCSTGGVEGTGFYMDRLHLTAENDSGW